MNNQFTNTNYDTRNQAFHFNDITVNFCYRLCISLQAYFVTWQIMLTSLSRRHVTLGIV